MLGTLPSPGCTVVWEWIWQGWYECCMHVCPQLFAIQQWQENTLGSDTACLPADAQDHHLLGPPPDSPDGSTRTSRTNSQALPGVRTSGTNQLTDRSGRKSNDGPGWSSSRLSSMFSPTNAPDVPAQHEGGPSGTTATIGAKWPPQHFEKP